MKDGEHPFPANSRGPNQFIKILAIESSQGKPDPSDSNPSSTTHQLCLFGGKSLLGISLLINKMGPISGSATRFHGDLIKQALRSGQHH